MKRHVTYVLEASDLETMIQRHQPLDLDVEGADSVSVVADAHPEIMDSAGGFRFVDDEQLVTDGGEPPEASDEDVSQNVAVAQSDLEEINVTLEQSLTRSGDEEVVRWTATAEGVDVTLGADTPAGALRALADELEVNGGGD